MKVGDQVLIKNKNIIGVINKKIPIGFQVYEYWVKIDNQFAHEICLECDLKEV
jgi:hypothetical protein